MEQGPGSIVLELERKLNRERYLRRGRRDQYCKISINYYWDLLKYIDDDYLTEWETLKFKDLYVNQLGNILCQTGSAIGLGYIVSSIIMTPIMRGSTHGYLNKLPVTALLAFFFCVQSGHWMRPNKTFHELM